ncbi:MAG: hypothetical protein ACRCUS_04915 [Anaerovoracaceae bacterium]
MISNIRTLKMVRHEANVSIYITEQEQIELIDALTPTEYKLYVVLKCSCLKNWEPEQYKYAALAKYMGMATKTLQNTYYTLKKKRYVDISFFQDAQKQLCVKLVIGKQMIQLHEMGIAISIANSKAFTAALKLYPIDDLSLTKEQLQERFESINAYVHKIQLNRKRSRARAFGSL